MRNLTGVTCTRHDEEKLTLIFTQYAELSPFLSLKTLLYLCKILKLCAIQQRTSKFKNPHRLHLTKYICESKVTLSLRDTTIQVMFTYMKIKSLYSSELYKVMFRYLI